MKFVKQGFIIGVLAMVSSVATAADFPTGTFVCSETLDENSNVVIETTVSISEQRLGNLNLPVLHYTRRNIQKSDISGEGKGLGSIIRRADNVVRLIGPAGLSAGVNFVVSADGASLTTTGGGACVKQ